MGGVIVRFERGSVAWLFVTEFFEGAGKDGASVFSAHGFASGFGFGGRGDDVFDRFA